MDKMFSNKHFKKILNILLLLLIFLSLACYYFAECKSPVAVVEGAGGKRNAIKKAKRKSKKARKKARRKSRKARKKARNARIADAKRKLEEKHKTVQENIHAALVEGVPPTGEGISNCAVAYGDNLQLGKSAGLFSIFGNNDILKCNKDGIPEFVPAKQEEINFDGIDLSIQNDASGQVMYGDTVSLCDKNYTISGKDSNTKVKYSDNITMTQTPVNENSSVIHATVNPNVYSLQNVMNLNSADYTSEYVKKYQYCGNSGGNNDVLAKG